MPIDYAFCVGDRARNLEKPSVLRGLFAGELRSAPEDVLDGTSNTIMLGEAAPLPGQKSLPIAINQDPVLLEKPQLFSNLLDRKNRLLSGISVASVDRGGLWADGRSGVAQFNTIRPPGHPTVLTGSIGSDGFLPAGSCHPSGLNIARADGSVAFISNKIDCGDQSHPVPTEAEMQAGVASPYGVWGALGTINGAEVMDEY